MAKLMMAERQNKIVDLLNENGSLKMAELAEMMEVSKETIRRDLIYLNDIGAVMKSHGGAISTYELKTKAMTSRIDSNLGTKMPLCQKALEYLPEQGVIYLDTGSTVTCFAKLLAEMNGLTIITNSLSAANALLGSNNTVLLTGGQINHINMSLEGYQATNFLSTVKFELAVFGTNGFENHNGPTTCDFLDVQSKQVALNNAKLTIVLADSSKAQTTSLTQYAAWRSIDYLITDDKIPATIVKELNEMTSVVIAG